MSLEGDPKLSGDNTTVANILQACKDRREQTSQVSHVGTPDPQTRR